MLRMSLHQIDDCNDDNNEADKAENSAHGMSLSRFGCIHNPQSAALVPPPLNRQGRRLPDGAQCERRLHPLHTGQAGQITPVDAREIFGVFGDDF